MIKLMIATPAFEGKVTIDYALCLAATLKLLDANEIPVSLFMRHSGSLLIAERNLIVNSFAKSDCTHLLMIDADIGWKPQDVLRLLDHKVDFVGATYPSKKNGQLLFRFLGDVFRVPDESGLLPVHCLPGGFVLVSKQCVQNMIQENLAEHYKAKDGTDEGIDLYSTFALNGEFWGEDFAFCIRARDAGIQVNLDTKVRLAHCGVVGEDLFEVLVNHSRKLENELAESTKAP